LNLGDGTNRRKKTGKVNDVRRGGKIPGEFKNYDGGREPIDEEARQWLERKKGAAKKLVLKKKRQFLNVKEQQGKERAMVVGRPPWTPPQNPTVIEGVFAEKSMEKTTKMCIRKKGKERRRIKSDGGGEDKTCSPFTHCGDARLRADGKSPKPRSDKSPSNSEKEDRTSKNKETIYIAARNWGEN